MNRIKYDSELMGLMNLFESMTHAKVKDCIADDKIILVLEEGEMGKAIGKNGANIRMMENKLKKKIKLVAFSNDVSQFVRNVLHPIEVLNVENKDGHIVIQGKDTGTKSMIIGRNHQNLNHLHELTKRYFDVKEINVV